MTTKFSFLFIFLIFAATCFSQEREIFVPENELGVLFEGATNRILIKRNEFETLRQQAREIQLETAEQDKDKPPAEAVLLSSDYRVEISDFRAIIDGTLEIEVLTDDLVSIPLPLERVAVLEAVFDDNRQPVAMSDNNGQKVLILSGKQRHRLRLRLTTPLEIDATRQRLNFRLIYGTETSFHLSVPGDVELKGGAAVLSRKVENGTTNFDLLLTSRNNKTEILMSLNSHRKGEYRTILARSVQFAEVTEQYERLHATVSLNELHQGIRETSFYVPAGFEITEVQSVFLDRWNVQKSTEKDKHDVLTIRFREQIPGLTTIYLSAIKSTKIDTQWSFPLFEPLDAAVHSAVLGLLLDEDLEMSHVESNHLFPVDTILLKEAIPPSALELLPGSPALRLVSAWYAPGKDELKKNVTTKFRRTETDFVIETEQILFLSEKEPVLQYTAKLTPRTGKIFETTLEIPENWNVLNVLDAAGQPLDFRFGQSENVSDHSETMSKKIIVRFPKGVTAGQSVRFSLRAVAGNVRDWFQSGTEKSFQYPVIRINGSANEQGNILIRNQFENDWEIIPVQTEHLTALNKNLSFQYSSVPFALSLHFEKLQPRLKAKTVSFYCFEPALFRVHYEVNCFIEQASIRQLTLLLPISAPSTPSIQGLDGLNIRETLKEETEINGQKFRRWKILFSGPISQKARISINFEQPIAEQTFTDTATPFDLPPVIVENTAWQSDIIAVEGDEELDLTIPTERNGKPVLRPVDAGELSVAEYRPGKRLLGVYSVANSQSPVTIDIRKNQTAALLSALIRHVSVTARFEPAPSSGVLYSILYEIQNAGGAVNIRTSLNKSDEFWSITLDGESIKAQRVGDDILIPISAQNKADFQRLVLLYRCPKITVDVSRNAVILNYPVLSINGKNRNEKIPIMQTSWNIVPPLGYEIIRIDDSALQEPQPALFHLLRNTIGFFNLLTYQPKKLWNIVISPKLESVSIPVPISPYFQNSAGISPNSNAMMIGQEWQYKSIDHLSKGMNRATGGIVQFENKNSEKETDISGFPLNDNGLVEGTFTVSNGSFNSIVSEPTSELSKLESSKFDSSQLSKQKMIPQFSRRLQSIQPVSVVVSENNMPDSVANYTVIGNRNIQDISVQLSRITVAQRWGWIVFWAVVLFGLCGLSQSRKRKAMFVFGFLIFGTVLIFVPGLELFATIFNGIVYGAVLTGAVYLVNALRLKIISVIVRPKISKPKISDSVIVSVFFFVFLFLPVRAAEQNDKLPKIKFPDDAIIVPYSSDKISEDVLPDPDKLTSPEQSLLVPYRQYTAALELLQKRNEKIQNNQNVRDFIVPFAVSAAEYQTALPTGGNVILLQGKIKIDVFTDKTVFVPLTVENGVLVQPLFDGKQAILHSKNNHQTFLLVEGHGSHELLFGIRVRIQRQGGWRIVAGKLPAAAVSKISLTLPDERGDLLTGHSLDKKKWSFGTNKDDTDTTITKTSEKIIEISPEPNGSFHWQWRSAVSQENVDRNLEVDSVIRYDIQEGGIWAHWNPTFRISRGKWEIIRLCLSQDYLIVEIKGENVRGWNIVQEDNKTKTIDVELLKPAEKSETLSILLSVPQWFIKPSMTLTLPRLTIPDAGIHRGRIDLFHSSVMNIHIQESTGLLPTDQVNQTESKPDLKFSTISPLGSSLFRSYRFSSENHSLRVKWEQIRTDRRVECLSVLKITRQDIFLETKIIVNGRNKPFYVSIQLPEKFVLKNVNVPDGIFWNKEEGNDKEKRLNIICGDGRSQNVEILVAGDYSAAFSKKRNEIETLPVFKTEEMKFNTIAVLTEPSLDVRADISENFTTKTPDSAFSWLPLQEQRELVRLVLSTSDTSEKYDGKLILSERKPEIRCSTITNVRTTAESIEETTLIDFNITKAGVRNFEFVLPAWMSNAKIDAPFLRRKTVTPLDTKNTDSPVLVRLELHEEVMEQFRILVQTDRRLQSETDYHVFVPIIRAGQTMRQYIVMENDRRSPDEMIVGRLQNLHALNRQQSEWSYLASILGGNVTEAYFATKKNDSEKDSVTNSSSINNGSVNKEFDDAPNLSFRMKRRETVRMADARIDLAETRFTLGDNGDYRAEQIYRIDNKKEPYLDILLPEGASLWGARILTAAEWQQKEYGENKNNIGFPVKPNMMPAEIAGHYHKNATETRLIRIPLVKTESGDMDFIVRLIYAGELQNFSGWARLDIPFIDVLNIPVGESLVRLNLPDRYEYKFKGNLRRVRQEQESETIRQVQSNYQRQQTDRLRQTAIDANPFASNRAKFNLKQLDISGKNGSPLGDLNTNIDVLGTKFYGGRISGSGTIQRGATPQSAESQIVVPDETKTSSESNSATLSSNFYNQTNKLSGQLVQQNALTINKTENQSPTNRSSSFNDNWFTSNSLSNSDVTVLNDNKVNTQYQDQAIDQNSNSIRSSDRRYVQSTQQPFPVSQLQTIPQQQAAAPQQQVIPQRQSQRSVEIVGGNYITLGKSAPGEISSNGQINQLAIPEVQMSDSVSFLQDGEISQRGFLSGSNGGGFFKNEFGRRSSTPELSKTIDGIVNTENNYGGQTAVCNSISATSMLEITPTSSASQKSNEYQSGKMRQDSVTSYSVIPESLKSETNQSGETIINAHNEPINTVEITEQILPTLSTRTSSLDIEIPHMGKTFLFVAPQGSLDLSFRTISNRASSRGFQMSLAFSGLAFLYGIYWLCLSIGNHLTFDRRTHRNTAGIVTLFCVLSLILAPLVSLFSFIFAVLLWITLFQRKSAT
ncbi:MAG: hypothetical protein LBU34_09230 [Planctomycetaceae bacterium]|jgi:hypothetical protein|nr:hypothetical protein [Planctomycetaceae bacterium]